MVKQVERVHFQALTTGARICAAIRTPTHSTPVRLAPPPAHPARNAIRPPATNSETVGIRPSKTLCHLLIQLKALGKLAGSPGIEQFRHVSKRGRTTGADKIAAGAIPGQQDSRVVQSFQEGGETTRAKIIARAG